MDFIHYLNLPPIPEDIINNLNRNWNQYKRKADYGNGTYIWSDSFNEEMNTWCQKNISSSMHFGFQIISGNLPKHKDVGTVSKLIYLVESGGPNATTNFYDDKDPTVKIGSVIIEPKKWHALKVDVIHDVTNVDLAKTRFSITGRLFGEEVDHNYPFCYN